MRSAREIPPCGCRSDADRQVPRRSFLRFGALPLVALAALSGCSSGQAGAPTGTPLLSGTRGGALATEQLVPAVRLAQRFAAAYARSVYQRRPARLPGASAALRREIAAASSRVPPARRGLHPRALAVSVEPRDARTLAGAVKIGDGRSPPFSVGFLVKRSGGRWRVVAVSAPG